MLKRVLFLCLAVFLLAGMVVCKKKPPSKEETRNALREGAETVNTDVLNNTGGKALIGSSDILNNLPIMVGKKASMLRSLAGGKKEIPRFVLGLLNNSGPWDTLAGKWRWNATLYQWEHYSTTPTDSILFEWVWVDSALQSHNCLLALSNYRWTVVGGEDALTKLMVDLRVDNTIYFLLNLKEVRYGNEIEDIRKVDVELTAVSVKFTFVFDYTSPPDIDFTFRLAIVNDRPWYQIKLGAKDNTPPMDSVVVTDATYDDYNGWKVKIDFAEPDSDGIQLIEGEVTKSGAHAAWIKSEKRYENGYPYLYVWLEYPDGTKETPDELFADLFPQESK